MLIRYGRFTPVAATLAMYIALGGLAFVLRDRPGGFMSSTITGPIMAKLGPVPWAFIVLTVIAILMETALTADRVGSAAAGDRVARGFRSTAGHQRQSHGGRRLRDDVAVRVPGGDHSPRPAGGRRSCPGRRIYVEQRYRRGPGRHQPPGRSRDLHRHFVRRLSHRSGSERDGLPRPQSDLAVLLPGRADHGGGDHLQPGPRSPAARL